MYNANERTRSHAVTRDGATPTIRYRAEKGSRRVFRFKPDTRARRSATESSDFNRRRNVFVLAKPLRDWRGFRKDAWR